MIPNPPGRREAGGRFSIPRKNVFHSVENPRAGSPCRGKRGIIPWTFLILPPSSRLAHHPLYFSIRTSRVRGPDTLWRVPWTRLFDFLLWPI